MPAVRPELSSSRINSGNTLVSRLLRLEAKKLAADAEKYAGEKEAEANKALAESLTEALIKYYEALGWDGKLPETVVSGTDTILPVLGGIGDSGTGAN